MRGLSVHPCRSAWIGLYWGVLPGAAACNAPAPEPSAPAAPPAALAPVASITAPAAPPAPEPADLCTEDGWCRPYVALEIASAAATTEAVAVATRAGTVALWADGRWQGGYQAAAGSELRSVERSADSIAVLSCAAGRCERRAWAQGQLGLPEPVSDPPPLPQLQQALGAWEVERSTLVRAGEPPLRLQPSTALGGQSCATRFGILGDAEHPFLLCTQHSRGSLHHVVGEELVTLVEPWDSTWVPRPSAVFEGAGCAPCLATLKGVLWRDRELWSVLPLPADLQRATSGAGHPEDGWGPAPKLQIAVEQGRVLLAGGGQSLAREGSRWVPAPPLTVSATEVTGRPVGETMVYGLSELELVVGGVGGVAWRPWSVLWPEGEVGRVRVVGVGPDDVLQVRAGPSTGAAPRGQLSPNARCVATVLAPNVAGWQAVELADGTRGWARSRYLQEDGDC